MVIEYEDDLGDSDQQIMARQEATTKLMQSGVLPDVVAEYVRAKNKHGENTLDGAQCTDINRLAALVEEVGEVVRAMTYDQDHAGDLRKELIQVANVALTWASVL